MARRKKRDARRGKARDESVELRRTRLSLLALHAVAVIRDFVNDVLNQS